jgi:putative DNA primase/helicase
VSAVSFYCSRCETTMAHDRVDAGHVQCGACGRRVEHTLLLAELSAPIGPPRPLSDNGNAWRLIDEHGADLRYLPGAGWYAWDGTRWLHDVSGEPMRRARQLAEQLRDEADLYRSEHGADGPAAKALSGHAKASASRRGLDAMQWIARSDPRVLVDVHDLDAEPLLLNAPNGTIDLGTGKLRPHDRGDLITRRVAVGYDPTAIAPTWEAFLERVQPDPELRDYAQRMAGAAAVGDNREELVHVHHGGGGNGKSKFTETIRDCLGDYAATVDAEIFLAQRVGRSAAQPELVRLRGVRLVTASETEEGRRLNVALVKALTGGDAIAARYLYSNEIVTFTPVFSPWLRTNHRPVIRDPSEAIWRRVRLVPFPVTITGSERDVTLQGRLLAELPGVLRWIVDGARAYLADGLDPPAQVVAATAAYREEEDLLGAFIAECCIVGPEHSETSASLFGAWRAWCEGEGEDPGSAKAFGMALEAAGFPAGKVRGARARKGLRVRSLGESRDDERSDT